MICKLNQQDTEWITIGFSNVKVSWEKKEKED